MSGCCPAHLRSQTDDKGGKGCFLTGVFAFVICCCSLQHSTVVLQLCFTCLVPTLNIEDINEVVLGASAPFQHQADHPSGPTILPPVGASAGAVPWRSKTGAEIQVLGLGLSPLHVEK